MDETEYDLAIDDQVEKFVETKQKLTYFLITASAVAIGFVVQFFVDNLRVQRHFTASGFEKTLVVLSSLAGLATAGLALLTLRNEHRSYALHLRYRYARKTWDALSAEQQMEWTQVNRRAARFLSAAFVALFLEIALAVVFFIVFFW